MAVLAALLPQGITSTHLETSLVGFRIIAAIGKLSLSECLCFEGMAGVNNVGVEPHLRLESNKVRLVYIALLKDQRSVSPPTKCYFGSLLLKSVYHYRIGECTYKSVVDFPIGGNDAAGHLSNFPCHQEVP
ncbi:hypothetical protein QQP08_021482 [Theobroma cacao]|nr:hypothetical protein QQP08_021482 [Theobroma cacao]